MRNGLSLTVSGFRPSGTSLTVSRRRRDVMRDGLVDVIDELERSARRELEHLLLQLRDVLLSLAVAHRARVARQRVVVETASNTYVHVQYA